jgi:hypothetical protein
VRSGKDFAALAKFLKMQNQGAVQILFGFRPCVACGNTAGHVRRIGQVPGTGFLDNDEIFFHTAVVTWPLERESKPYCKLRVKTASHGRG